DLPQGEVLIRVRYSSLNYKDALSATGTRGVTRVFPHTPGIDAAGEVVESSVSEFAVGDEVVVTGYDLGMNTAGGFGQYIRVPAHWVVQLPEGLTLKESMGYGTAGFTAALSVYEMMEAGVVPDQGEVVVTGATGGVGSLAVAMLAKEGFSVVAATGKASEADFLKGIGASEVMGRGEVDDDSGRPILSGRWAGGVDTVGGNMLATLLKTTNYGGAVTCCGLVASPELDTTVFPFILRGIKLIGIDSVLCPMDLRLNIWEKIATDWKVDVLDDVVQDCGLADLDAQIDRILAGQMRGRVVVDLG
ncbi:MAG: YhdH/YhfP family quinone oxidoreductase, partial [Candidatus Latescibacteria bacterium]|nr:YhdH/YhfP family quinone oxidoreductase [Candidatus Latescibacterota bacterium]